MTETEISPAEVLQGQLKDVLVEVPANVLSRLERRDFFAVNDWIDVVKESAQRMLKVPPPPAAIKRWLRPEQLAGEWSAFTNWRPSAPKKEQRGLFA